MALSLNSAHILMSLVVCSFIGSLYATDLSLEHLTATLCKIDGLESYGPVIDGEEQHDLHEYLAYIHTVLCKEQIPGYKLTGVYAIAASIFSRYAYSNGSQRSRVYAQAQQQLITLLSKTHYGQAVLSVLAQEYPVIELYRDALV